MKTEKNVRKTDESVRKWAKTYKNERKRIKTYEKVKPVKKGKKT
jgi:hypothetical protein